MKQEEDLNNLINKYKILDTIEDLSLLNRLSEAYGNVILYGEFEIEPFIEFSLAFQAEYWYLKYCLLKNGEFSLEYSEQTALYEEKSLNIIWLTARSGGDIIIECKDGDWYITYTKQNENSKNIFKDYRLSSI